MKKRLQKKLDKKLYRAIKALNEDVMKDLGEERVMPHEAVLKVLTRIHRNRSQVSRTLKDYETYIVNR